MCKILKGLLSSFKEPSSQKEEERKRERRKEKGEWGSPKQPVKKYIHGQSDSQIARLLNGAPLKLKESHEVKKKKVIMGQSDYLGQKFGQRHLA